MRGCQKWFSLRNFARASEIEEQLKHQLIQTDVNPQDWEILADPSGETSHGRLPGNLKNSE